MRTLFGGLVIENSRLESLSIFTSGKINFFCETYGFFIRNNSLLTDINILNWFYMWGNDNYEECQFRIENNPKLDTSMLRDNGYTLTYLDVKTEGNLKECGCRGDELLTADPKRYNNCETLFGGFKLNGSIGDFDSSLLSNITTIKGLVNIENSDLEDLSFLKSFRLFHIKNIGFPDKITLNLRNNPKMKRLGLPSFWNFQYSWAYNRIANFEKLHSDFCVTFEEMVRFLENQVFFMNIHAKYCEETGFLYGNLLCNFVGMSSLMNNCYSIVGNVEVNSGDEQFVSKLKTVYQVFGTVKIDGTNLTDLSFLSGLRYIASLDESLPAIQILSNKGLKNASLSALTAVITRGKQFAVLENNHPDQFNTSEFYKLFPKFQSRAKYFSERYFSK
ncbi:hypothetical protein CAEBREN_04994 [Caenorhabditis brenneri]|uniref:Receptor L-domain domain-containing protein n=1 Tax=Caenorhabditis brenneri TaxID=135651 RepID=G0MD68_CAEBE|nr:hypothetical protein CAEBREN_04994 [Caenorhabditis brenneri]